VAHISAICNQKGGVGKTTTANALVAGLTNKGYKTLAIDTDPQGNLTNSMQADDQHSSVYEVMKGAISAVDAIQHTAQGDIISSSLFLTGADLEFTDTGREYLLKDKITPLVPVYDYIIIDSPPTLGILTINALTAANDIIIPMGADVYSLQGLGQLYSTINKVKKYCNSALNISGLLVTRYSGRSILAKDMRDVIDEKAKKIDSKLFKTVIREGIAVKEAQAQQISLFSNGIKSNPAQDYVSFIEEYLKGEN